ncbi:MAG: hypothetical protein IKT41_03290 [Clostridia bacterium]|nr:hypothetical protein [Clostridia bacterium]
MEYAKDEIFNIRYREDINRLEITKDRTSKILNILKKNKVITVLVIVAVLISIINTMFIVNFFNILFML